MKPIDNRTDMKNDNYSFEELCNHPAFKKWAKGQECEDFEKLENWILKSEENRKIAIQAQREITGVRFKDPQIPDLDAEWQKVKNEIESNRLAKIKHKKFQYLKSQGRFWQTFYRVAAVLILGAFVGLSLIILQDDSAEQEKVTIKTDFNDRKSLVFPDGSTIDLAANSSLSYKSNYMRNGVLQVKLSGEAYFFISSAKTKIKPKFVVETKDGLASVWGTQFSVNTQREGTQVVLEEGEVRIRSAAETYSKDSDEVTIKPGEMAIYTAENYHIKVNKVNPKVYTSWVNSELYFDETPFSVLVDRIERTYGFKVEVKDSEILDTKLSGTVDFRGLEELIEAVSEVMEITMEKKDEKIVITK
jgi:ferric-dicitrate binding protein FerR (iron transport regulator)